MTMRSRSSRSVRRSETSEIRLIGLLDDRLERKLRVQGLQVFGSVDNLEAVTANLPGVALPFQN